MYRLKRGMYCLSPVPVVFEVGGDTEGYPFGQELGDEYRTEDVVPYNEKLILWRKTSGF